MCSGMQCGIKQTNRGGNFGFMNFVSTGKHLWNCFFVGTNSEAGFNCPFEFVEDGTMAATKMGVILSTPTSSAAVCTAGQMWADAGFVYVCTATNTIKRVALSSTTF
jgi:hypothetical protein